MHSRPGLARRWHRTGPRECPRTRRPSPPPCCLGNSAVSGNTDGGMRWLAPILPGMPGVMELDVARLRRFEVTLGHLLAKYPVDAGVPQEERSVRLAQVRRDLAAFGQLADAVPAADGGAGRAAVLQAPLQFVCGYHDIDLRDSISLGHGRLIARHGSAPLPG